MRVVCPTCNQVMSGQYVFNSESGTLMMGHDALKLTRMEVKLLCLFLEKPQEFKDQLQMTHAAYDGREPLTAKNTLKVIISRFRKKLKAFNLTIEGRMFKGHRLALCEPREAFELRHVTRNQVTQIKGVDLSPQQQ